MKRAQFKTQIQAPAEHVYRTMLGLEDKSTYEQWTAAFHPTSTFEGTWEKASKMYFVGTDENGKRQGMVSEIADNVPCSFVSIRHIGVLDGDKEVTEGPEVEAWAGGLENYSFSENEGVTTLTVEVDVTEEHQEYFDTTWPKAFNVLKGICEKTV